MAEGEKLEQEGDAFTKKKGGGELPQAAGAHGCYPGQSGSRRRIHPTVAREGIIAGRVGAAPTTLPQWRTLFGRLSDNGFGGNGFSGVFVCLPDDGWRRLWGRGLYASGKGHGQSDENEKQMRIERFHKLFVI